MAPRNRKTGPRRKPSMKTAQKMVTKQHKSKAKRNMDTFFLKVKTEAVLTPTQGISVANYIYNTFTLSPVNVGTLSYFNNKEFNLYRIQYDKFRVNSISVNVVPKANVLDQVNAQNAVAYNVNGDGSWHTCVDRDGNGPNNIASLSRYPSYRKFDAKKPWTRTYAIKYPTGVWIDCQSAPSFELDRALGLQGGITVYAENFLEDQLEALNEPVASIIVSYNIVFQGKTSASLMAVYDASNNVVGMTITQQDQYTPANFTVPQNIRGSLNDTLLISTDPDSSGNVEIAFTDRVDADAYA